MRRIKRFVAFTLSLLLASGVLAGKAEAPRTAELDAIEAVFYYPNGDVSGLSAIKKQVFVEPDQPYAHALLAAAMEEPEGIGFTPLFGQGARIDFIEDSGDILTLSVETRSDSEERLRALSALAVWKLLSENTNLLGINVLVDSCAVSYQGKPLNTLLTCISDATAFEDLLALAGEHRAYTVYLPDKSGTYLLPILMSLVDGRDDASALISGLCLTTDDSVFLCIWPKEFSLLGGAKLTYSYTVKNRRLLTFSYADTAGDAMKINEAFRLSGMQQWQLIAALTLTFTTNLPDVERLSVKLLEMQIQSVIGPHGSPMRFERGEIPRRSLQGNLATVVRKLEYDPAQGIFRQIPTLVSSDTLESNVESLATVITDSQKDAISSLTIMKKTAYVNLTGEFYAEAQSFSAEEEKLAIYAIVNALAVNFGVNDVYFAVEGHKIDTLSGSLALGSALHPDYGLIE